MANDRSKKKFTVLALENILVGLTREIGDGPCFFVYKIFLDRCGLIQKDGDNPQYCISIVGCHRFFETNVNIFYPFLRSLTTHISTASSKVMTQDMNRVYSIAGLHNMPISVMDFQDRGYKIRKSLA
jgi:hypothetical protein